MASVVVAEALAILTLLSKIAGKVGRGPVHIRLVFLPVEYLSRRWNNLLQRLTVRISNCWWEPAPCISTNYLTHCNTVQIQSRFINIRTDVLR